MFSSVSNCEISSSVICIDKIKGVNPHSVTGNDGVLKTFYNILESHRVLCDEVDRIEINYAICQEEEPSPDYIDATKRYEQIEAKWDLVDILLEAFSKKTCDKITDGAIEYIAYGKHLADLTDTEIKDYIYALKKVKKIGIYVGTVMKLDFSETIEHSRYIQRGTRSVEEQCTRFI